MLQEIKFNGKKYKLILTQHAVERMQARGISREILISVIEHGRPVEKNKEGKWWVYMKIKERIDNDVCISISIESPNLIVITTLVNWRPLI
jgi:hypothetical protein